jgi:hypothetical protein
MAQDDGAMTLLADKFTLQKIAIIKAKVGRVGI